MRNFYAKSALFLLSLSVSYGLFSQNVAINNSGNSAYVSAILDLSNQNTSGTVGFLPPYVDLNLPLSSFQLSGTAAQSNGIIIYATGVGTASRGLYYWNNAGSTWVSMGGGGAITANNGLTMSTPTNVQLGGSLSVNPTAITQAGNTLTISGGPINLNNTTAFTTTIGNGTNALTENGNTLINANNAGATTGLGTGTTTGAVSIGNSTGSNVFVPGFNAANQLIYTTNGITGQLAALPVNATAVTKVLTQVSSGAPAWSTEAAISGGPLGSVLSNSPANTPAWTLAPTANNQLLLSNTAGVPTWSGAGVLVGVKVYSVVGAYTYVPDPGTNLIIVEMVGGGGGGGGGNATSAPGGNGGGGGAGAYDIVYVNSVSFAAGAYTGTIGAGGNGAAAVNPAVAGSAGGATTFVINGAPVITCIANGGNGGNGGTTTSNAGGTGGLTSPLSANLAVSIQGASGGFGVNTVAVGSLNVTTVFGVVVSVTTNSWGTGISGYGASSHFGGGAPSVGAINSAGISATPSTGSGGSGGSANYEGLNIKSAGGNGAAGIVIVYEYR